MNTTDAFIEHSRKFLSGQFLPKIERCLAQLTDEQIWWRTNEDSNSIGNLLLHLSGNVRQWIVSGLGGAEDRRVRQVEFDERSLISKDELLQKLRQAVTEADAVLSQIDTATLLQERTIQGSQVTALYAIYHVVEHFSMHTGQIILLTKMLAGQDMKFYKIEDGTAIHNW